MQIQKLPTKIAIGITILISGTGCLFFLNIIFDWVWSEFQNNILEYFPKEVLMSIIILQFVGITILSTVAYYLKNKDKVVILPEKEMQKLQKRYK